MSVEIAKLREDGTLKALEVKWFKRYSSVIVKDLSGPPTNRLDLYRLRGLFLTSALSMALALLGSIVYLVREKMNGKSKMQMFKSILQRSPKIHARENNGEITV